MEEIVVDTPASEASALLAIENPSVLKAEGWSAGFWTCSDEQPVEKALGALGHRDGGEWELRPVNGAQAVSKRKTEDCEAMARLGDWVYILGSHFGSKDGRLEPSRDFVARFNEARLAGKLEDAEIEVEVAHGKFKLHRLVNDALLASGLELIEPDSEIRKAIRETRRRGRKKGKKWAGRIEKDDWPINVEGAAFRESGSLLLGLRYPVTREGHPILVELDQVDRLFRDPPNEPAVQHLWVLDGVGSPRRPRGIRALERVGGEFHAITGSLDSMPEKSRILEDHPEGAKAGSCHLRFHLPPVSAWTGVGSEVVHDVGDRKKVEGLATDAGGSFYYVIDDERIRILRG